MEVRALTGILMKESVRLTGERLAASGIELNAMQTAALHLLAHEPHTAAEVSRMMAVDPSTMVPLIDALEARGLVERQRDPADRRRHPLHVTTHGQRVIGEVTQLLEHDRFTQAMRDLGLERAALLRDLVRELVLHMVDDRSAVQQMLQRLNQAYGLPCTPRQHAASDSDSTHSPDHT
jgi:DNA-binding MarR family transcriptional regulator